MHSQVLVPCIDNGIVSWIFVPNHQISKSEPSDSWTLVVLQLCGVRQLIPCDVAFVCTSGTSCGVRQETMSNPGMPAGTNQHHPKPFRSIYLVMDFHIFLWFSIFIFSPNLRERGPFIAHCNTIVYYTIHSRHHLHHEVYYSGSFVCLGRLASLCNVASSCTLWRRRSVDLFFDALVFDGCTRRKGNV